MSKARRKISHRQPLQKLIYIFWVQTEWCALHTLWLRLFSHLVVNELYSGEGITNKNELEIYNFKISWRHYMFYACLCYPKGINTLSGKLKFWCLAWRLGMNLVWIFKRHNAFRWTLTLKLILGVLNVDIPFISSRVALVLYSVDEYIEQEMFVFNADNADERFKDLFLDSFQGLCLYMWFNFIYNSSGSTGPPRPSKTKS